MKTLQEYLDDAAVAHGHLCAGQVLGVRMAMLGLRKLGLEDPQGKDRKRIVTFVEIDRCATDAVMVVTGCRLGKRALKFRDWGKVAATFVDVETGKAVRVAARESSKALAKSMHPEIPDKNQQQMLAYREIADDQLFQAQWVHVELPPEEFPGYKGERIVCAQCGEGINFRREVKLGAGGEILVRGDSVATRYWRGANPAETSAEPASAEDQGWLHTGDIGVMHADGYIQLKARSKDIIISGGENISSIEVEDALYKHPAVAAAAVVAKPDDKWGETPCAFVELKPGATATADELMQWCRKHLAAYKCPRYLVFAEIPKTSTGKIQKFKLREMAKAV